METKLTQRDKILLIILLVVIVVFAAVMIPKYGIKDLIVSIKDNKTAITKQESDNKKLLTELQAKGIPTSKATNYSAARSYLMEQSLQLKFEAFKLSQTLVNSDAYGVAESWILPAMYVDYIQGNNDIDTRLMKSIKVNVNNGYNDNVLNLLGNQYDCRLYSCTVDCYADDTNFYRLDYAFTDENTDLDQLAFVTALYSILEERGSIEVTGYSLSKDGKVSVSVNIRVPKVSSDGASLADYGKEIHQCPHCGAIYSNEQYDSIEPNEEGDRKCTNTIGDEDCTGTIPEETIG